MFGLGGQGLLQGTANPGADPGAAAPGRAAHAGDQSAWQLYGEHRLGFWNNHGAGAGLRQKDIPARLAFRDALRARKPPDSRRHRQRLAQKLQCFVHASGTLNVRGSFQIDSCVILFVS